MMSLTRRRLGGVLTAAFLVAGLASAPASAEKVLRVANQG